MDKKNVVLIVEDEAPLQEIIKTKLELSGFDTVTARSVKQAKNLIEDLKGVDAIWLDHYLFGKEDGLDFVAMLKNNKQWSKIPIMVVSNTATEDKVRAYLSLGVNKYYTKSDYRLDQIVADMKKIIK